MKSLLTIISIVLANNLFAQAGPFAPPVGQLGTTAIHKDSSIIVSWAIDATIQRGNQNIANPSLGNVNVGDEFSATGVAGSNGIVSLGDGGIATLTFSEPIANGPGPDFAVFENSFDDIFLELAFVEVSSNGIDFFRFDAVSLTDTTSQTGSFGSTDATNLFNLAGKYRGQYGTPFDLDELKNIPELDINSITHVRVIDVVGSINSNLGSRDAQNNLINDPFPTPFPSGGFDLDAVGIINTTPTTIGEFKNFQGNIYPNPIKNKVNFKLERGGTYTFYVTDIFGKTLYSKIVDVLEKNYQIDLSSFNSGIYIVSIHNKGEIFTKKIIKQ